MMTEEYRYEPENQRRIAIIRKGKHEVKLILTDRAVAMGSRFNIPFAIRYLEDKEREDYYEKGLSQYGTVLGL